MGFISIRPKPITPGSRLTIVGDGFSKQRIRLSLDGLGKTVNIFKPANDGTFKIGINVSSTPKTQLLLVEQYIKSKWTEVARTIVVVAIAEPAPPPPPPVEPPAPPSVAEWELVFEDNFSTWDSTKYSIYQEGWQDTSKNGTYWPSIISASDGTLKINLKTEGGLHKVAAFIPRLPGGKDLLSMRVEYRLRADKLPGFKGVPLLWPGSEVWPRDGEINWPEGSFDKLNPQAFMHRQNGTSGGDQDYYNSPVGTSWQDWHTYAIEWVAGVSCEFFIDSQSIGKSTNRVPSTPMHFVAQFETAGSTPPDSSVSGFVEMDYLKVFRRFN